jgi:hypothetical protein
MLIHCLLNGDCVMGKGGGGLREPGTGGAERGGVDGQRERARPLLEGARSGRRG